LHTAYSHLHHLDGVVDADLYVSPVWMESLQDADAVYDSFSTYCFDAGEKCNLFRPNDKSAKDIADRLTSVLEGVRDHPLTLINHATKSPIIVTESVLKQFMFAFLYAPIATFPLAAIIVDILYRGQGEMLGEIFIMPEVERVCGPQPPAYTFPDEAQPAIMCSDKRHPVSKDTTHVMKI
jgi:hypothetical protein